MTMRERMARALETELDRLWDSCEPVPYITPYQFEAMAIACLRAMREPDKAMTDAGGFMFWTTEAGDPPYEAKRTWQAMIDAALSEKP